MYHCHLNFYCTGPEPGFFDPLLEMPALEPFTHTFTVSDHPVPESIAAADVILADLRGVDGPDGLQTLLAHKKGDCQLILLAGQGQLDMAAEPMAQVTDVWTAPMPEEELRFRFRRWQKICKMRCDYWETGHFLEALSNSSPNLIWYKSKSGIHEKVNDSFCRVVGKSKDDVQGRDHAYIWNVEAEDPACIQSDQEVMESGATQVSEERIQTGDGERILSTYKSPLCDMDGSVMGTVGVALDVTQERAYEADILKKNRTLEWIFTTMECGVLCHSVDGARIININRAALKILGYESQRELEADGFDTVAASVLDEDKPHLRECIHSLHGVNDSVSTEYRVRHKDGTVVYVMGNIKLVEENGEWFYQRFLLDFTAQKLQEQAQQRKLDQKIKYQEQLFNVFSTYLACNTDDVYMMLDANGERVEYISPNVDRVLGITPEEVQESLRRLSDTQGVSGEMVTKADLCRMEPGDSLEARETERINHRTGEHKWFWETVYCVSLQGEKKIVAYISDRTKERNTRDTLTQALDMAQVANKAKSAFLSSVSHDIRTPMNAIMGFITLLREEAGNKDRVLEYAQQIDAASQHLLGLINDVLDMNKIESGIATLNLGELRLADIIDEINTIIRPQAKAREQTFEIHASSLTYEHLVGDQLRINQILINILSNAVKYTQKGGCITMTVTELPQAVKNYSRIQFVISDNGHGMSEAYQKVIFKPFSREQDTLTNQVQGTGLGMSITKSLVDLMGGTIQVESQLGKGSTFTVELELRIQEKETDPRFWDNHGICRMIVADDDENVCKAIARSMSETGVKVDFVTHGEAAAEMIRQAWKDGSPYDLLLLDWKMPGLNGLETARLIREHDSGKLPILLFTAYDWADVEKEALEVGISHFLPKPFFMSNFRDAIRRIMGSREQKAVRPPQEVLSGRHVLVVDDIEVNRMILVKILTTLGAVCDTAENGQIALDKFLASAPDEIDIIMMDIQMPIMDGYTAARAIRASGHPSAGSVAVVAMTANAFVDDVREALKSGMDAHIAKPIVVDKMLAAIREVFEAKGK